MRCALPFLLALAPLVAPAGAFGQDDFQRIYDDYKGDGKLNYCYSPGELHNAGRQIPPDIAQYAPGFGDALSSAQGRCGGSPAPRTEETEDAPAAPVSAGTPGPGAPEGVTRKAVAEPPAPKAPAPPAITLPDPRVEAASAAVTAEMPGALIALLIAAGIAVALALAWAVGWLMGWNPERLTKPLFATVQTVWDRLLPGR